MAAATPAAENGPQPVPDSDQQFDWCYLCYARLSSPMSGSSSTARWIKLCKCHDVVSRYQDTLLRVARCRGDLALPLANDKCTTRYCKRKTNAWICPDCIALLPKLQVVLMPTAAFLKMRQQLEAARPPEQSDQTPDAPDQQQGSGNLPAQSQDGGSGDSTVDPPLTHAGAASADNIDATAAPDTAVPGVSASVAAPPAFGAAESAVVMPSNDGVDASTGPADPRAQVTNESSMSAPTNGGGQSAPPLSAAGPVKRPSSSEASSAPKRPRRLRRGIRLFASPNLSHDDLFVPVTEVSFGLLNVPFHKLMRWLLTVYPRQVAQMVANKVYEDVKAYTAVSSLRVDVLNDDDSASSKTSRSKNKVMSRAKAMAIRAFDEDKVRDELDQHLDFLITILTGAISGESDVSGKRAQILRNIVLALMTVRSPNLSLFAQRNTQLLKEMGVSSRRAFGLLSNFGVTVVGNTFGRMPDDLMETAADEVTTDAPTSASNGQDQ